MKASDPAIVVQACELMNTLRLEADMKMILCDMLEGMTVSDAGQIDFARADLWKRTKTQFRESLGWCILLFSGRLQELSAVELSFERPLVGVTVDELKDAVGKSVALKTLNLNRCPRLENVDFLAESSSLIELNLRNSTLKNIEGIRKSTRLRKLVVHAKKLDDLEPLSGMTELTELTLDDAVVEHLDELKNCTKLQKFSLSRSAVVNLDALAKCQQLQELSLWSCTNIQSVDALGECSQLVTVNLGNCTSLTSVVSLNRLPKLSTLLLGGCVSLQGIDELTELPSLSKLMLFGVPLHSLDAVLSFSNLINFGFGGKAHPTKPSLPHTLHIEALLQLENLSELTISHFDQLKDLQLLRNCRSLRVLSLNSCKALHSIDGIKNLPDLEYLKLHLCKSLPRHLRGSFKYFKERSLQKLLQELV